MIRATLGLWAAILIAICGAAHARDGAALARLDSAASSVQAGPGGLDMTLALSRIVPWRVGVTLDPAGLSLSLEGADLTGVEPLLDQAAGLSGPRLLREDGTWTTLWVGLASAHTVSSAEMRKEAGGARLTVALRAVPDETATPEWPDTQVDGRPGAQVRQADPLPGSASSGSAHAGRLVVMLDPGHGGVDPGAVRDGVHEADLTLAFARTLRDILRRDGSFTVEMTRDDDTFVSLQGRIAAARDVGADLFVSIHADAIAEGVARGVQVYTLSEEASSRAGALLAERHNRADLLAGLDLSDEDDQIAQVLMDLARSETAPRSEALADALVAGLGESGIRLHTRPRESAAFAVLRAPDIPSALVEIGFMSSPRELAKLTSPEWREKAAAGLAQGLVAWAQDDAARARLGRK